MLSPLVTTAECAGADFEEVCITRCSPARYCVENQSLSVATGQILLKGMVMIELSGVVVM